jgi:hypothetical protein
MHTLQIFQILGPNDTIIFGEILELYYLKTLRKTRLGGKCSLPIPQLDHDVIDLDIFYC